MDLEKSQNLPNSVEFKVMRTATDEEDADQSDTDEQTISKEEEQMYMDNCGFTGASGYDAQNELSHEREEIEKAVRNNQITPGRAKLQLWLYRSLRIVMTDGRILIGIFLCTDSDANVILGVCSEFTKNGGDERMLGLVMVPGKRREKIISVCVY